MSKCKAPPDYFTPRDLAREMGQSERTARRVFAEAGLKHEKGQWWRLDPERQWEKITIEEVRRRLANPDSARRFGCRRRRREKVAAVQMAMFQVPR